MGNELELVTDLKDMGRMIQEASLAVDDARKILSKVTEKYMSVTENVLEEK